jgi:autotransporter-associated beta strand protein
MNRSIIRNVLLLWLSIFAGTGKVSAASGVWTNTASGKLWSGTANWTNGIVADGSGSTADFSQVNIPAGTTTVHLDASHTLTALIFGDSNAGTAGSWALDDNSSSGANALTLSGSNPTITVNTLGSGASATISANIAGTTGWTKLGSGLLILSGANTYNAPTTISTTSSSTVTLSVNSIGIVGGGASALGAPTTAASGQINLGKFANLTYTGGAATSDRVFSLSQSGGNAAIANNGSGTLTLSGGVNNPGVCSQFILRGVANITESGILSLGTASLLKTDAGTVTLTTSNNYSGGTTVSVGTLLANNMTGSGSISGNVIFNTGANLSFTVGSPMTIGGNLTISNNTIHLNIAGSLANGIYTLATYKNTGTTGSFVASPVADSGTIPSGVIASVSAAGGVITLAVSNPSPATYFVATNGSDSNPGTLAQPFLTIQKAASLANTGTTVNIRAGTYRETVTVLANGTSNAPITFQAYSNEVVTIDGTDPITGWSTTGGNIWTAPMNWTLGTGDQVFINGAMMPAARWPNAGSDFPWQNSSINPSPDWTYTTATGYDANGHNGWFSDTNLPSRPDGYWNGATVNILNGKGWVMNHMAVVGYTNATKTILTTDASGANVNYALRAGNEYYITGKIGELDSQGEWFYGTNTLYLYSTNSPAGVTAKHRQFGFDLTGQAFIMLKNLHLFACNILTDANSTDETFDGLVMQFPGNSSVISTNSGLTLYDRSVLRNSELAWDSLSLLTFAGDDIRVINNYFHDSGFVPYWPPAVNVVTTPCYRNLFSHNTITNTGRESIGAIGKASIIEYNDMSYPLKIESDGGVLHITYEAGNTVFRYNRLHDAPGPKGHAGISSGLGFYLDSQCSNWIVHHNCMWNVPFGGIQVNLRRNFNLFYNNTVWNTSTSLSGGGALSDGPSGVCFFNNLFNTSPSGSPWTDCDLRYNFYTNTSFVAASSGDFRLQAGSPAIGAGTVIPGVTDGFTGAAPDLGAFEYGGANWATNTGYSTNPPSPDPTYNFPNMVFANQVADGSFESGNFAPNWTTNAGSSLILLYSSAGAWTDTRLHMGYYSVQFNPGTAGISQTITGLLANCSYQLFAGIEITNPACTAVLGVTNCGPVGADLAISGNPLNTNLWTMFTLPFTTGPTNTSAQIYLNVSIPNGATPAYADDFSVQVNTLWATNAAPYSPPTTPTNLSPTTVSNSFAALKWSSSTNAVNYNLKRALAVSGPYTNVATQIANTNFTDATITAATTYYYVVSASNGFGESTNSTAVSLTTAANPVVSIPAFTSVSVSGTNIVVQGTNGSSGAAYVVLTATNLTLPLASWQTNLTGNFSGGGGFSNSISVNPGSQQQFYRVRTP